MAESLRMDLELSRDSQAKDVLLELISIKVVIKIIRQDEIFQGQWDSGNKEEEKDTPTFNRWVEEEEPMKNKRKTKPDKQKAIQG